MTKLRAVIQNVCKELYLVYGDGEDQGGTWVEKVGRALIFCTIG